MQGQAVQGHVEDGGRTRAGLGAALCQYKSLVTSCHRRGD